MFGFKCKVWQKMGRPIYNFMSTNNASLSPLGEFLDHLTVLTFGYYFPKEREELRKICLV